MSGCAFRFHHTSWRSRSGRPKTPLRRRIPMTKLPLNRRGILNERAARPNVRRLGEPARPRANLISEWREKMATEINKDPLGTGLTAHTGRKHGVRRLAFLLVAVGAVAGGVAFTARASRGAAPETASLFITKIPDGYRDWAVISVAHEAANFNSLGAVLGNDVAIKAYREGKLPFPDGTIIAALHWRNTSSE